MSMKDRMEALEANVATMREETSREFGKQGEGIAKLTQLIEGLLGERSETGEHHQRTKERKDAEEEGEHGHEELPEGRAWLKRVEMPIFGGEDPLGWITRAENFFEMQEIPDSERIKLSFVSMEGHTIHWFRVLKKRRPALQWPDLVRELIKRFGDRSQGGIFERLKTLHQKGTVDEYIQEFEVLVGQIAVEDEEQLLGYFLGGLRPEIRHRVRTLHPVDVTHAMEIALDVEVELREAGLYAVNGAKGGGNRFWGTNSGSVKLGSHGPNLTQGSHSWNKNGGPRPTNAGERPNGAKGESGQSTFNPNRNSNTVRVRGNKEIPYSEFIRRREEGKCYYCGLAYTKGHDCQAKHLRLTILAEVEGEGEGEPHPEIEDAMLTLEGEGVDAGEIQWLELSAASASGLTPPRTIKLGGVLQGEKVVVLIDSGASHNFICRKFAGRLGLKVTPTAPFGLKP